ncbi:MAG: HEAT repeat domain-containing protein, partial [Armatimonadota bacterium]|nr:HEAT repeat domain-containing protein [Armatimonadota bacterium]MDT7973647.1 HEAT repeat domain-containing protein [Armatimonadota bacterium]
MRQGRWTFVLLCAWALVLALHAQQGTDYEVRLKQLGADPQAVRQVVAQLQTLLRSEMPEAKIGALDWLLRDAKTHDPQLASLILPLCQDPNGEVRLRAVRNLRWLIEEAQNAEAMERLVQALMSDDKAVRLEALNVLRQSAQTNSPLHRHERLIALLPKLVKHPDPDTAAAALGVIA